ncbi:MAG: hypothetical protein KGJ60_03785 [Verrucomicrobiota bacterium]|nr:hypothetical protein [Verrucomicrobiota bacterium]
MKATKKLGIILLTVGGLLVPGAVLHAQDSTNAAAVAHPARGGRDRLAQALNLTDEQKPKVQAAFKDMRQQMRDLRQNTDLSRKERMAKAKTLRENLDAKLKDILTPEQFQKWQDMRSKMRHRRNGAAHTPTTPPQN